MAHQSARRGDRAARSSQGSPKRKRLSVLGVPARVCWRRGGQTAGCQGSSQRRDGRARGMLSPAKGWREGEGGLGQREGKLGRVLWREEFLDCD